MLFNEKKGFTRLEILVAVFIIAVIASLIVSSYYNFIDKQRIDAATENTSTLIQKARALTLASKESSGAAQVYGIHFDRQNDSPANQVVLFTGATYTAGAASNEPYTFPGATNLTSITGLNDLVSRNIVFKRLSGEVQEAGNVIAAPMTLTIASQNYQKVITVFPTGVIQIQ